MGLIGPRNIRRSHQNNGSCPLPRRGDEFMDSPVLEHEAQDEHQRSEGVVDALWSDFLFAALGPDPAENNHRHTIDRP